MTKEQKQIVIANLTDEFKTSNAIVVADYNGISHKKLEELRMSAKEAGAKVQVAKNTLVSIAVKNAGHEELTLSGTNIFVWADDQLVACKVADKFSLANKDKFIIKTGIVEGKVANVDTINALAKLPGRDELLGMLAATWMAPVANFTIGLDALRKQKEESA